MRQFEVQDGTITPANKRPSRRKPIEFSGLTSTKPVHPQKSFSNGQSFADEDTGSWIANELGEPLSGYERHVFAMIDAGLADHDDLF
jgi:hypothetical protein